MILVVGDQHIQPFCWGVTRSNGWKLEADKFIIEISPYFSKQGENYSADSLLPGILKERLGIFLKDML